MEDKRLVLRLGSMPAWHEYWVEGEQFYFGYTMGKPWTWPAVENTLCAFETLDHAYEYGSNILGNISVRIGEETCFMRCGLDQDTGEYIIYGLWKGYDSNVTRFNRNVRDLKSVVREDYTVLFPIDTNNFFDKSVNYDPGETNPIYRSLVVTDKTLEPGTYYLEYVIYDIFQRPIPLDRIEMYWDGEKAQFPHLDEWQGEEELEIPKEYWQ